MLSPGRMHHYPKRVRKGRGLELVGRSSRIISISFYVDASNHALKMLRNNVTCAVNDATNQQKGGLVKEPHSKQLPPLSSCVHFLPIHACVRVGL